jgi:hypothetical protein
MKLFSFEEFVNEQKSFEVYTEALNEGFNSSILQKLSTVKKGAIGKAFFDTLSKLGVAASEITNLDIQQVSPDEAEQLSKKNPTWIFIYYSEKEKENPYSKDSWYKRVEGDCVLAVGKDRQFMALKYDRFASKGGKAEYTLVNHKDKNAGNALGGQDKSGGKYGSGLVDTKRIAAVSDVVYVINPDALQSTLELRKDRKESKQGAIAFIDDKDFKSQNMSRYNAILTQRAAESPVDKMVEGVIETLTEKIKAAIKADKKGRYGSVLVGVDKKGKEISMQDVGYMMQGILSKYESYAQQEVNAKQSAERWGSADNYYERQAAIYAKDIKDYVVQAENISTIE